MNKQKWMGKRVCVCETESTNDKKNREEKDDEENSNVCQMNQEKRQRVVLGSLLLKKNRSTGSEWERERESG